MIVEQSIVELKNKMVGAVGFEPTKINDRQIYSLLLLSTQPHTQNLTRCA